MHRPTQRLAAILPISRVSALVTAGVLSAAAIIAPSPAGAQSVAISSAASYACDFENSYCDFAEQAKIGDAPPSTLRRSSIIASGRTGSYAVRLHTEPGDDQVHGSGTWERDDLTKAPDASYCNEGQEEWWAVSMLYPSDYSFPAPGQGGVFIDFHHNADSGLPNFSVEARGESGLRISGYGGAQLNGGQYRVQIADPYGATNNVTRNVWYDYVFHIKWSSNGNGLSEAWLNGKKILSYSGATLYSGISCYLKLANYHDATGQPSSIIFDRVLRGSNATDVAIGVLEGVGSPLAPGSSTPSPGPGPSGPSSGAGSGSGSAAPASATMDSSSYTIAAGQSVTFTARVLGNSTTPTGMVSFASDGAAIAGCGSMALSSGAASCTTSALPGGQHKITGAYSGDVTYGTVQAGPITQMVNGTATSNSQSLPTKFGMDSSNYSINVGDSITFTARIPGSGGAVKFIDNGTTIASCEAVPVSSSGSALCTTSSLAVGTHAIVGTYSGNGSYSAGVAGPIAQTVDPRASTAASPAASSNVQGLWWGGPSESGWGINFAQQGAIIFATWFTYDAQGKGTWLVMSDGRATGANSYGGTLYRTNGPALGATFDVSKVTTAAVGSASFSFIDSNHGSFTATVDGISITKNITRQVFDIRVPVCTEGGDAVSTANYQDLWWRLGGVESGWGLNLTHQGDTMFLTWFAYADDGSPMWLVASNIAKQADGSYGGTLYRTTGPAFDAASWDPSRVSVTPIGSVRFTFTDGANGTFSYAVNGASGSKPISRQIFSTPPTVCLPS